MNDQSTILIVDDDIDLIKLLTFRLQGAGYRVESADSAERALAKLSIAVPHLVITDLRMGGMDGMALFQNIRKTHPALPVIILTAHGTIPDAVAATQRGVFGYLTKPFDSKELLSQVEKAVSVSGIFRESEDTDQSWREEIITRSPMIESILAKAKLVAASDASILITGDSGTGKEMLARAIHRASPRSQNPFVAVNCSAIPDQLLESELFGHMKGSFTGAARDYQGLVQAADTGTIFLDEIGDMPLPLQVKLLRVLQEREIRPVGSTRSIAVNIRVISATHRDLEGAIRTGDFREDLYYRLNVVSFHLPPLAERREDIPVLATHFLNQISAKYGKSVNGFSAEAMEMLVKSPWPGNVRELYNVIEQSVALSTTPIITPALVESALRGRTAELASFESARSEFEREYLAKLLKITGGNVTQAAKLAKRNRTEFYKLLQRHHLNPKMFKAL
jgi:two-component system response regulator GlrR